MKVSQLLAERSGPVFSTEPEATIREVTETLQEHKIGLLVVCGAHGEIVGVISERDIIRGLAENGAGVITATVSSLMTKDVLTCTPDDDTSAVLRRLWINNIRHMPVVRDDLLVGILSVRDLLKSITEEGGNKAREILLDVLREGRYYPGA